MNAGDGGEDPAEMKVLSLKEEMVLVRLKAMAERVRERHLVLSLAALTEEIADCGGVPDTGIPTEGAAAFEFGQVRFVLSTSAGLEPGVDVEFLP